MSTSNGNKNATKYQAAVDRARGIESETPAEQTTALALPIGAQELIKPFTAHDVELDMAKNELEWAPQVIKLEEGMLVEGILEGGGGEVDLEVIDRATMTVEVHKVNSWIVRHPVTGYRISFLSSVQLDAKLPPFVGGKIKIYVGPMLETQKGRRYRDFRVGGERRAEGARTFARQPNLPGVIDVATEVTQPAQINRELDA